MVKPPSLLKIHYSDMKGYVNQQLLTFLDDNYWCDRFEPLNDYFNFREEFNQIHKLQNHQNIILNNRNLQSNFSDYMAFHVIKPSRNFQDILFMHSLNSLYYNLYDVNQDFVLYHTIDKLCKLSKQFQMKKQLKMRSITFVGQNSPSQ